MALSVFLNIFLPQDSSPETSSSQPNENAVETESGPNQLSEEHHHTAVSAIQLQDAGELVKPHVPANVVSVEVEQRRLQNKHTRVVEAEIHAVESTIETKVQSERPESPKNSQPLVSVFVTEPIDGQTQQIADRQPLDSQQHQEANITQTDYALLQLKLQQSMDKQREEMELRYMRQQQLLQQQVLLLQEQLIQQQSQQAVQERRKEFQQQLQREKLLMQQQKPYTEIDSVDQELEIYLDETGSNVDYGSTFGESSMNRNVAGNQTTNYLSRDQPIEAGTYLESSSAVCVAGSVLHQRIATRCSSNDCVVVNDDFVFDASCNFKLVNAPSEYWTMPPFGNSEQRFGVVNRSAELSKQAITSGYQFSTGSTAVVRLAQTIPSSSDQKSTTRADGLLGERIF